MGKIVKRDGLFGYIYKGRKLRKTQDLRKADFAAVRGLANGIQIPPLSRWLRPYEPIFSTIIIQTQDGELISRSRPFNRYLLLMLK